MTELLFSPGHYITRRRELASLLSRGGCCSCKSNWVRGWLGAAMGDADHGSGHTMACLRYRVEPWSPINCSLHLAIGPVQADGPPGWAADWRSPAPVWPWPPPTSAARRSEPGELGGWRLAETQRRRAHSYSLVLRRPLGAAQAGSAVRL
jgi:hypothetical protein